MPDICSGFTPDSITEETKAAKLRRLRSLFLEQFGVDEVEAVERWFLFSMRPNICVPQALQAWRWINRGRVRRSQACRRFRAQLTFWRGTTATTENVAPCGFQHLVQPQAWFVGDVALHRDLDLVVLAFAGERAAGKMAGCLV